MGHAEISGSCRARCGQSRSLSIMDVSGYVRLLEAPDFGNGRSSSSSSSTLIKNKCSGIGGFPNRDFSSNGRGPTAVISRHLYVLYFWV